MKGTIKFRPAKKNGENDAHGQRCDSLVKCPVRDVFVQVLRATERHPIDFALS